MIRRGDEDSVDVLAVEHLAVVAVGRAGLAVVLCEKSEGGLEPGDAAVIEHAVVALLVYVAESRDPHARHSYEILDMMGAHTADTDKSDADRVDRFVVDVHSG